MDKKLIPLVLAALPLVSQAEIITCKRVLEVEGRDFVYEVAPKVPTRVPSITFDTSKKLVEFKRMTLQGGLSTGLSPYVLVLPNEEFETSSLGFKTENGESILNFSQTNFGRYEGSPQKYLIGEFFDGELDISSWTYLCPMALQKEIE